MMRCTPKPGVPVYVRLSPRHRRYLQERAAREDRLLVRTPDRPTGRMTGSGFAGVIRRLLEREIDREGWTDEQATGQDTLFG